MPYEEPNEERPRYDPTIMEQQYMQQYVNPENVFIKHLTQRQPIEGVIDNDFLKDHSHRVMFTGKEKSLAFIENPKTIQVNTCQRMNLSLMESLGLYNLIWSQVWDNMDIMVTTQGQKGNMMNAMITKRQEFKDTTLKEKKRWTLPGLMKKPEEPQPQQGEVYY